MSFLSENYIEKIHKNLLEWFVKNGRHWIPWKLNSLGLPPTSGEYLNPYKIWIAEVMLQQTQLKVMLPYWLNWMKSFKNLGSLAEADYQDILLHWQGLGYYRRAKWIKQTSQILIKKIDKFELDDPLVWPQGIDDWLALPGIGRSTAGSILSSSFDSQHAILDGNVKRIFSRLIASKNTFSQDQKRFWNLANKLVLMKSPRNINQALMDLGATICITRKPKCDICPLKNLCRSYINFDLMNVPLHKNRKKQSSLKIGLGIIFNKEGKLLIAQRLENTSMGGMWEFPGGKNEPGETIENTIEREILEELGIKIVLGQMLLSFDHEYTHKKLHFTVHICQLKSGLALPLASKELRWVDPEKLSDFPFPSANHRIISALMEHLDLEK